MNLIFKGVNLYGDMIPFTSHVEIDGLLVTGQHPLSVFPAAKSLIRLLEEGI
jgi:putative intracellular protease/amidase